VALTYIPNPENYSIVNHIDGNPSNNHVKNLEWCTRSHNVQHAYDIGLNKRARPVLKLSIEGDILERYKSVKEASRAIGIHSTTLTPMLNSEKIYRGFIWKYES
jgi:hypothetical protein